MNFSIPLPVLQDTIITLPILLVFWIVGCIACFATTALYFLFSNKREKKQLNKILNGHCIIIILWPVSLLIVLIEIIFRPWLKEPWLKED